MTHVDIYLETSSIFQGITDRKCGYVLSVLVHNEEKTTREPITRQFCSHWQKPWNA